jgi:hypothetical protein
MSGKQSNVMGISVGKDLKSTKYLLRVTNSRTIVYVKNPKV